MFQYILKSNLIIGSISCSLTARRRAYCALYHTTRLLFISPGVQIQQVRNENANAAGAHAAVLHSDRLKDGSWHRRLKIASSSADLSTTMSILRERCERGTGLWTARAFNIALRSLPPRLALQVYDLARSQGVQPTPSMANTIIDTYAALGMMRHIEGAVKEMLGQGLQPHWSIFFKWQVFFFML